MTSAGIAPTVGALLLAAMAVRIFPAPPWKAQRRIDHVASAGSTVRRVLLAGVAVAAAVFVVQPTAVVVAVLAGLATSATSWLSAVYVERRDASVDTELLVLCCELWAATMGAGATVATGLGQALGVIRDRAGADPAIRALTAVHGLLQLGTDPAAAWSVTQSQPTLAPLANAAARSSLTGAELAASIREHADLLRREQAAIELGRAERAGVLMTAPLTLCFLPGFICLGLAPVVIALLGSLDIGR